MEDKTNDATPKRPEGERTIDAPLVNIDLNGYIRQIKSEEAWLNNKRNSITLFKSDNMRIVMIGLHMNTELPEHTADGVISVQALEGHIIFKANNEEQKLTPGNMVTLHEKIPHSVVAVEDSVFLLTMAMKK
ncbi:MAG: cupin domain-containing protein [Chitinophagaceae bacterium]|nr:cupin domain-containing protein [Chitinophagaceae bacterium]MCB9045851.1 cupin domain-containing protein [Chitinophagales bacterium]